MSLAKTMVEQANWGKVGLEVSSLRVLIVEDFPAHRRFIRSTLEKRPGLEVIREASDGLEAVRDAEELKPDLIVLDIGLPTLNGIEAARRIRAFASESRIIFVSQESSADIVQEALSIGACSYVLKTKAATDLLPALDAAIADRQFVSTT